MKNANHNCCSVATARLEVSFSLGVYLKTNRVQYSLRCNKSELDAVAMKLVGLRDCIDGRRKWVFPGEVSVLWNENPQYSATLAYYGQAGYLEINIDEGTPLRHWAEGLRLDEGDHRKPRVRLAAVFSPVEARLRVFHPRLRLAE